MTNHTDSIICRACIFTFSNIQNLAVKYGWYVINPIAVILCSLGLEFKVCRGTIGGFGYQIYYSLLAHYFSGETICSKLFICPNHFIEMEADDYAKNLLKDKPSNKTLPDIDKKSKRWKVLHVTDIHVDSLYKEVRILWSKLGDYRYVP